MKYDKQAVVDRVEKRISKIEEGEEARHRRSIEGYQQALLLRNQRRMKLFQLVDDLKGVRHGDRVEDDKLVGSIVKKFEKVGRIAHGYSSIPGDEFIGQILQGAAYDLEEPVKDTRASEDLREVLEVFKTGAPPEVGVNDLRAFGLMQFLKYDGR